MKMPLTRTGSTILSALFLAVVLMGCKQSSKEIAVTNTDIESAKYQGIKLNELSNSFKEYWYSGEAEITSYKLNQARYGELREGTAVLVFVTEDFLPDDQVKAESRNAANIPVLKLNSTKTFNTGIYPYSVMQSTFYPVASSGHAIKVSSSMQEWCGHVYTQLNNRATFEIRSHSYFEGEADRSFSLDKDVLENELWTQLRLNPQELPTGQLDVIPAFDFLRFRHLPVRSYKAHANLESGSYTLSYPDIDRSLTIRFNPEFPYDITGWEESYPSGFGPNARVMISNAGRLASIRSPYWQKNKNSDEALRKSLLLD